MLRQVLTILVLLLVLLLGSKQIYFIWVVGKVHILYFQCTSCIVSKEPYLLSDKNEIKAVMNKNAVFDKKYFHKICDKFKMSSILNRPAEFSDCHTISGSFLFLNGHPDWCLFHLSRTQYVQQCHWHGFICILHILSLSFSQDIGVVHWGGRKFCHLEQWACFSIYRRRNGRKKWREK